MDKPYRFLKLNAKITPWKELLPDLNNVKPILDWNATLLSKETRKVFKDIGLEPAVGVLWVHNKGVTGDKHYVAGDPSSPLRPYVSINILLEGSSSIIEWVDFSKSKFLRNSYNIDGTIAWREYTSKDVDYSAVLQADTPVLYRIDVPHRVKLETIEKPSWAYSIRFIHADSTIPLSWDDALVKFKSIILEKK